MPAEYNCDHAFAVHNILDCEAEAALTYLALLAFQFVSNWMMSKEENLASEDSILEEGDSTSEEGDSMSIR